MKYDKKIGKKLPYLAREKIGWIIGDDDVDLPRNKLFNRLAIIDGPRADWQVITMTVLHDSLSQQWIVNT